MAAKYGDLNPCWICPDCGWLNVKFTTYFARCYLCDRDHLKDWDDYIEPCERNTIQSQMVKLRDAFESLVLVVLKEALKAIGIKERQDK